MPLLSLIFAAAAALIHLLFFLMESVFFQNPKVYRGFGVKNPQDAGLLKVPMFNQGFYNLFLALGVFEGIYFLYSGYADAGKTLVLFCCASMFFASLVLLASKKGMLRGVLLQGTAPLAAILSYWLCSIS